MILVYYSKKQFITNLEDSHNKQIPRLLENTDQFAIPNTIN